METRSLEAFIIFALILTLTSSIRAPVGQETLADGTHIQNAEIDHEDNQPKTSTISASIDDSLIIIGNQVQTGNSELASAPPKDPNMQAFNDTQTSKNNSGNGVEAIKDIADKMVPLTQNATIKKKPNKKAQLQAVAVTPKSGNQPKKVAVSSVNQPKPETNTTTDQPDIQYSGVTNESDFQNSSYPESTELPVLNGFNDTSENEEEGEEGEAQKNSTSDKAMNITKETRQTKGNKIQIECKPSKKAKATKKQEPIKKLEMFKRQEEIKKPKSIKYEKMKKGHMYKKPIKMNMNLIKKKAKSMWI